MHEACISSGITLLILHVTASVNLSSPCQILQFFKILQVAQYEMIFWIWLACSWVKKRKAKRIFGTSGPYSCCVVERFTFQTFRQFGLPGDRQKLSYSIGVIFKCSPERKLLCLCSTVVFVNTTLWKHPDSVRWIAAAANKTFMIKLLHAVTIVASEGPHYISNRFLNFYFTIGRLGLHVLVA